jgi:hypothetical protein
MYSDITTVGVILARITNEIPEVKTILDVDSTKMRIKIHKDSYEYFGGKSGVLKLFEDRYSEVRNKNKIAIDIISPTVSY